MNMKRSLTLAALTLVSALALSACADADETTTATTQNTTDTATETATETVTDTATDTTTTAAGRHRRGRGSDLPRGHRGHPHR